MTPTIRLNLMHKQIILMFSGYVLQKAGELLEGWNKESHEHIQHTADVLENRSKLLRREFDNVNFADEDQDDLKRFLKMLKQDFKNMIFNIQNDKLPKELFNIAKIYLQDMENMIEVLGLIVSKN